MPIPQPDIAPARTPRKQDVPTTPTTMVVVCRDTDDAAPNACVHRWKAQGWRVRRREPRVLEGPKGPSYGVLLVLERETALDSRLRRPPVRPAPIRRESPIRTTENV